jgi:hypothetical protein
MLTLAFRKKLANLKASVALHYAHYNFVRVHRTLRCTPAMAAGVTDRLWSVEDLLESVAQEQAAVPAGPPFNVAQLFKRMADGIRDGRPVSPGFDLALTRHRLLDAIQKASDSGIRQVL